MSTMLAWRLRHTWLCNTWPIFENLINVYLHFIISLLEFVIALVCYFTIHSTSDICTCTCTHCAHHRNVLVSHCGSVSCDVLVGELLGRHFSPCQGPILVLASHRACVSHILCLMKLETLSCMHIFFVINSLYKPNLYKTSNFYKQFRKAPILLSLRFWQ